MIYLTQLIFVKEGKEAVFHQFEEIAIPLMADYNGKVMYRIRPGKESFVSYEEELPYEIHFISFQSEQDFKNFLKDRRREEFMHLKEEAIKSTFLVKGTKI